MFFQLTWASPRVGVGRLGPASAQTGPRGTSFSARTRHCALRDFSASGESAPTYAWNLHGPSFFQ